jgi:hypothetical protein
VCHSLLTLFVLTVDHFYVLHKQFWNRGEHNFVQYTSVKIPDPLSLEVDDKSEVLDFIELPQGPRQIYYFGPSKLLVLEIYETFWGLLESEDHEWQQQLSNNAFKALLSLHHSTIVTGQPGIGQYAIAHTFYNFSSLDFVFQERHSF